MQPSERMRFLALGTLAFIAALKRIDPVQDGKTHEETDEGRSL